MENTFFLNRKKCSCRKMESILWYATVQDSGELVMVLSSSCSRKTLLHIPKKRRYGTTLFRVSTATIRARSILFAREVTSKIMQSQQATQTHLNRMQLYPPGLSQPTLTGKCEADGSLQETLLNMNMNTWVYRAGHCTAAPCPQLSARLLRILL